ncbi:7-cyano-7-deazaguanine reductase [Desulfobacula phenolica]|uniref:NADPH-dependent 7-cyano-7-deazaguanine reductase n=2 Tax=Desulfobacula phenolica TaxID=90732 RepID=A0A1H2DT31_9BACT|nr:7-cyano-7-deazaguanine reductase [Desulfobacula phenolica]
MNTRQILFATTKIKNLIITVCWAEFYIKIFMDSKDKINMTENKAYVTRYKIEDPSIVKADLLEPIPYAYKSKRSIDIIIKQPEYTSVCPMTGLPDNGCITIKYRPDQTIVELKSLKYYLLQFRNVGMFYEHVVNKILDDLVQVLTPLRMEVTGEFTPRGGISSIATAVYEKE